MAADSQRRELLFRRAAAQRIGASSTPAEAAAHLLAVQAQDFAAARWALGIRSGATEQDVLAAFDRGELVRAWTMRGTLFALPATDLAWKLSLTGARMHAQAAARRVQLGLDDATIDRVRDLVHTTMAGGGALSRAEFLALLAANDIDPAGQRGYHLIAHLAQGGTWCWGPMRASEQLLVLHDEWVPSPRRLERDEALGEFVFRYLLGHGPATVRDFAGWSKLTLGDARRGLAVAADRLVEYGAGSGLWMAAEADATPPTAAQLRAFSASVHAMPGFDESYLGYADRTAFIDAADEPTVVPGGNGVFQPTILAAGRVIGTWRRATGRAGVSVEARPFDGLTAAQAKAFTRSASGYARFLGRPLVTAQ